MSNKTRGLVLLAAGLLLALVALFTDELGLGGHPGVGRKQLLGALVGFGVAAVGLWVMRR
ncbi:MAG: hypothetical protein ACE5EG_11000 [Thermoanaerobaculia bacterium]